MAELPAARGEVLTREIRGGTSYRASLLRYRHSGLVLYALVARPHGEPPANGWPVLVANHGTHPDPPRYGWTARGENWRPGDYYRVVPEAYAAAGFVVVMPDYRGHNTSDGAAGVTGWLASSRYSVDVLALLDVLEVIPEVDLRRVAMWGHSLGGEVTLRALLASTGRGHGAQVRVASIWSPMAGSLWEQAMHFSNTDKGAPDKRPPAPPAIAELELELSAQGGGFDHRLIDPQHYLDRLQAPLILQHAREDRVTPWHWSQRLAAHLHSLDKPFVFHTVASSDHFLTGRDFEAAVNRDVAWFNSWFGQ